MATKASNQITIVDVTDAYSVILTSEAYTFVGGTGGAASGSQCTTQAVAYRGAVQLTNVQVVEQDIVCPSGITASVSGSGGSVVTITFTLGSALSTAAEATIPVTVDGITINKKFSFAVAKTGSSGKGISSVTTYFQTNNAPTAPTAGTSSPWSITPTMPSATSHYMWAYDYYTYTDSTHTSTTVRLVAEYTDANKWYSGTAITGTSTTPTVFSGSGITNAVVNDHYLNTSTGNTYICTLGGNASTAKWKYEGSIKGTKGDKGDTGDTGPQGPQGPQGDDGADAIVVSVTSNNGFIFKNSSGSTTLTAHVFVGGVEATIANDGTVTYDSSTLGTIKWYKEGTQAAVATAKTYTVQASQVSSTQAYTCNLEG